MSTIQTAAVVVIPGGMPAWGWVLIGGIFAVALVARVIKAAESKGFGASGVNNSKAAQRQREAQLNTRITQQGPPVGPQLAPPVWDPSVNPWVNQSETPEQFNRRTGQS